MLALLIGLQLFFRYTSTAAIGAVVALLGKSKRTLWSLLHYWQDRRGILVISTAHLAAVAHLLM